MFGAAIGGVFGSGGGTTGAEVVPVQSISLPMPSNQMGTSKPVFSPLANKTAGKLFGANPQEGLGANAPMFEVESKKYNNKY
jgi:hypothetical protein